MDMTDTFTWRAELPGRRSEIVYVLAYEAAKRLEYTFEHIGAGTIRCRFQQQTGRSLIITMHPDEGNLEWVCLMESSGSGAAEAAALFAAFEETISGLAAMADEELLQTEYNVLRSQFFAANEELEEEEISYGDLLRFRGGYRITPVIIIINVFIYLLMVGSGVDWIMPNGEQLLGWGANFKPLTLSGEWWRILTSGFLHFGLIHLAMNMFAFIQIGLVLERLIGVSRFAAAYLIALVTGSLLSLVFHDNAVSAGASGAVFGMYGVFLALLTTKLISKSVRKSLLSGVLTFVGYNLIFGLQGSIDNAAHIGGLLGGMLAGYAMVSALRKKDESLRGKSMLIGLAVLVTAGMFCLLSFLPNDYGHYDADMKAFSRLEEKALAVYKLPENTPDSVLMPMIKNEGIASWDSARQIILGIRKMDLPKELLERNETIKTYCDYRIRHYELAYKRYAEQDTLLDPEIQMVLIKIDSLLKVLNTAK